MTPRKLALIAVVVLGMGALAQTNTPWGTVVLPPGYDPSKPYPVLIDLDDKLPDRYLDIGFDAITTLPAEQQVEAIQRFQTLSNGTLTQQFAWWLETLFPNGTARDNGFILTRISAEGISRDYRTANGFTNMIEGYERKVLAAYTALTSARRVDTARVFLSGFSIGGDVSWALALRNPSKIRGAILQSSRATYRASTDGYATMVSSKARFAVIIGDKDDAGRIKGARDASALLKGAKVPSVFCLTPGATHQPAPLGVYSSALSFLLSGRVPTSGSVCRAP